MSQESSKTEVFVRKASGLIRPLTGWDGALIALSQLNFLMGLMELWSWGVVTVQQAHYGLAMVFSAPLVFTMGAVWVLLAIMMPRSGGEYVWVSRGLHPALGFMVNFFMVFLALNWTGLNFWLAANVFLPGFLQSLGLTDLASVVAQPINSFLIALILVVIFTIAFIPRVTVQAKILRALFIATFIGWIALVATLIFPTWDLATVLRTKYGIDPESIIQTAISLGYKPGWTLLGSILALPWAMQMWGGWWWAPYAGGEIQNPKKSMWIAVIGATAISIVLYAIPTFLAPLTFGFDLYNALNYIWATNSSLYPSSLPPPYFNYAAQMVTDSYIIKALIGFGFFSSILFIIPSGYFVATRSLFAWAFDRVAPEALAHVSERFHSPVVATVVTGILMAIFAYLQAFTAYWGYLVNLMIVLYLMFMIVFITAIIFPYKRKEIYNNSLIAGWKIFGLPALTVTGILALLVSAFLEYTCLSSPALGGPITWESITAAFSAPIVGLILYYVAYFYRKRQGIDLNLVFKEIPPA